ncbi:transporter [Sphingobacterium sp. KB22]|uniref:Transporter n=2 Tax=Sphingobacterium hungaricum TaxID=2082723 RepID=A0A928UTG7_9SPHI|nr:transporter [Sphingobacterium hungaricum]
MANPLFAQEELTLQEAITFALKNKADAKKSALDIENAEYQIDEVRAGALPQLSATASLNYNPILQKSPIDVGAFSGGPSQIEMVAFGQKWGTNATASVSQQIFNQALFTGLKAAKTTREFYMINNTLTEELLIEKVANSYYEVFQTQQQLKTLQSNLDNTKKTRGVIEGLVKAGLGKKIDLDRTTVAVNNLESQKQQLVNALEIQENALKFAIGMDIRTDIELPKETFNVNLNSTLETNDVNNRTEILALNTQTELLKLNKKSMMAAYYPSLSISGNLGNLSNGNIFPTFGNSGYIWSNFSSVGLNLTIPIFTGGATRSKIRQADIEIRKAAVDIEDTKLGLNLANENAKAQIKNSLLVINSNEENVGLAEDVLENTRNNYRNGLATLTELLEAETAYADAQNNYTTSLLNYKVAEIQLIKANGNLKSLVNE